MARLMHRLSARKVKTARPKRGRKSQDFADGGNLYLQASLGKDGHVRRSWIFKSELRGLRHEMGLGSTHTRSLKEARDEAKRLRILLLDKIDPLEARDKDIEARAVEAAKDKTFAEAGAEYLRTHRDDWKNAKHVAQWQASLTKETKAIAHVPVGKIDVSHVLAVLQPIWKTKPESASRLRGRVESVIAYGIAAGYRRREDGNPARWDASLKQLLGSKAAAQRAKRKRTNKSGHFAAVPYAEMPAFMERVRARESLSARALEFTVLTAARTSETIGATWREFDFVERVWTVPAHRIKMGREHKVPLSDRAIEILRGLKQQGERVFPLSDMAMLECLRDLWPNVTVHGTARSSFTDWAHERTAFPKTVIDMALAHAVGDKVEAAYRRGDLFHRRRELMEQWSTYCALPPTEKKKGEVGNVTALRERVAS